MSAPPSPDISPIPIRIPLLSKKSVKKRVTWGNPEIREFNNDSDSDKDMIDDTFEHEEEKEYNKDPSNYKVIEKWNWESTSVLTSKDTRRMFIEAYIEGIKTVFSSHTYSFNNEF